MFLRPEHYEEENADEPDDVIRIHPNQVSHPEDLRGNSAETLYKSLTKNNDDANSEAPDSPKEPDVLFQDYTEDLSPTTAFLKLMSQQFPSEEKKGTTTNFTQTSKKGKQQLKQQNA